MAKLKVDAPFGLAAPAFEKSWIRHWCQYAGRKIDIPFISTSVGLNTWTDFSQENILKILLSKNCEFHQKSTNLQERLKILKTDLLDKKTNEELFVSR